jgi:hypothetical protein
MSALYLTSRYGRVCIGRVPVSVHQPSSGRYTHTSRLHQLLREGAGESVSVVWFRTIIPALRRKYNRFVPVLKAALELPNDTLNRPVVLRKVPGHTHSACFLSRLLTSEMYFKEVSESVWPFRGAHFWQVFQGS